MNKNLGNLEPRLQATAFTRAREGDAATPIALVHSDFSASMTAPVVASDPAALPKNYIRKIDIHWWIVAIAFSAVLWAIALGYG